MLGIVPAAGAGTRFKELGKQYSKTVLPYKEKPILIHQIEWLQSQGCKEIRVVINHQERTVLDILNLYNKNVTIKRQETRDGLSGAIRCALNDNDNTNVLVLLGDLVVDDEIDKSLYNKNFISAQKVSDFSRWCMVGYDDQKIKFWDKPIDRPPTDLAVSGVYHFLDAQLLISLLDDQLASPSYKINGEFQISTVLQSITDIKGMNIVNLKLIDFGTLEEYLTNRSVKISRSFNDIKIDGPFITKSSEKEREKIIKEYNWFTNLPDEIAVNTPRIFNKDLFSNRAWYKMEKILAPSLREIYLFLDSSEETWDCIFDSLLCNLKVMESYGQPNSFINSLYEKTKLRVNDIDIPIENKIVKEFLEELKLNLGKYKRASIMHGDYCFSNLLYDFQSNRVKMIDPRGELFGDHYYELAKLYHSIVFDYDFVDAELYVYENDVYKLYNDGKEQIKELFKNKINKYYTHEEQKYILLICASLFLSMIPLHSHNRTNQQIYYDIFKKIFDMYRCEYDIQITRQIID